MNEHQHCYHLFTGPIMVVIKPDYVLEKCCSCGATRQSHRDHQMPIEISERYKGNCRFGR